MTLYTGQEYGQTHPWISMWVCNITQWSYKQTVRHVNLHVSLKHYTMILQRGHEYGWSDPWISVWVWNITQWSYIQDNTGDRSCGFPCGSEALLSDLTYRTRVWAIGAVDLHVGLKHYTMILHTGHKYGRSEPCISMWVWNITQWSDTHGRSMGGRAMDLHEVLKHYTMILHIGHEYGRSEPWISMWVWNITQWSYTQVRSMDGQSRWSHVGPSHYTMILHTGQAYRLLEPWFSCGSETVYIVLT